MKYIKQIILILLLSVATINAAIYSSKCPDWSSAIPYAVGSCVSDEGNNYIAHVPIGAYQRPIYGNQWDACSPGECEDQFLTCADNSSVVNDTIHVVEYDTTNVAVSIFDTTHFAVNLFDTTRTAVSIFDTTRFAVSLYDTTRFAVSIYDTTKFVINKYDTVNNIINVYDTTRFAVSIFDTTRFAVNMYDTTNIYDTNYVSITDTVRDTTNIYDTTHQQVVIYDITYEDVYSYDTITLTDTLFYLDTNKFSILDSVYINNKMFTVSTIVKDDLESAPILVTLIDTNIFNVGVGDTVTFHFDLNVYDNAGQFVNRIKGVEILFDGYEFHVSKIQLISIDSDGYLISKAGKKLGNGVYILKGIGLIKVNGNNQKTYFYNSTEGYRRK
jgi:hypothetical protein